ncbi:hypothetical protein GQ44DRAFT_429944 [Phaeosphaeriaceae sp. PMI808]|nr:hypothetical protein GQ44DRAFT_429944 [Phaeosphaeriaceae sp. PMI808]
MKSAISFTLFGGVLALTSNKLNYINQQIPLKDACPSDSLLVDGACQLATYDQTSHLPSALAFGANVSQISQTLEEARSTASDIKDFPWTFWPDCFANEETPEPYCTFSDQSFASGRGIFIVTTKPFAYAMLEKPAFTNPKVLENVNKYENPPFELRQFPGRGRGLVANKTLHRGDQLFASTPILITDSDAYELSTSERLALLYRGVETLPSDTQTKFWALLGHFDDDPVEDRINTNNFDLTIDGVSQQGLFPEIAMLNHDCRPNAAYFFDEEMMTHYLHAVRDILPGEEITITYIDNEKDKKTRMAKLEKNWGFKCACSTCTAHKSLAVESDSRLYQITDVVQILDDWTSTSMATPEVAELLISLYVQERLDASLGLAYKHAAETYSSFGKKWEAIKYARLSAEMSMLDKGFRDGDVQEMKKMGENPEMTWSWKKRVGLNKGCGCGHAH